MGWPASAARAIRSGTVEDRLGRLVEREAPLGAQLGRHPDLGVDDAVGREVLGAFAATRTIGRAPA